MRGVQGVVNKDRSDGAPHLLPVLRLPDEVMK
jgi:hypothetical protein